MKSGKLKGFGGDTIGAPSGNVAGPNLEPDAVRAALDQLLADPLFASAPRNKEFLRFIVEKTLAGKASRIKSYTIAVDVFKLPSNFDPALDPIVRIEASRLRAALDSYYSNPAVSAEIRITLPRGAYIPAFSASQSSALSTPARIEPDADDGANVQAERETPTEEAFADRYSELRVAAHVVVEQPDNPRFQGDFTGGAPAFKNVDLALPALVVDFSDPLQKYETTKIQAATFTQSLLIALGQYDGIALFRPSLVDRLPYFGD